MATAKYGWKDSEETLIFRAIEGIIRSYPPLATIKTWGSYNKRYRDIENRILTQQVTETMLPMIRLIPAPGNDDRPRTQLLSESTLRIHVASYVGGMDSDDIMNLWGEIRTGMGINRRLGDHGNDTILCYLQKLISPKTERPILVSSCRIIVPGYYNAFETNPKDKVSEKVQYHRGIGRFEVTFAYPH